MNFGFGAQLLISSVVPKQRTSQSLFSERSVGSDSQDAPMKGSLRKDRKSTRLNSSHRCISYAVFCLKKKKKKIKLLNIIAKKRQGVELNNSQRKAKTNLSLSIQFARAQKKNARADKTKFKHEPQVNT